METDMRDFAIWLGQFRDSISRYDYYVNFDKAVTNAENVKAELCLLNSLVGMNDIEYEFRKLFAKYPSVLQCIPILLAVREMEIFAADEQGGGWYDFSKCANSIDEYCIFMRKTGLFDLISKRIVSNLYDYALGVETGLDSNGRKNRGGHQMEDLVECYLKAAKAQYQKEMYSSEVEREFHIDLSAIADHGKAAKRFDFVVSAPKGVYAIETNFYASSGSKLNETARSYKNIAINSANIAKFSFVWITDGKGWLPARNNLKETFDVMQHIYNLEEIQHGIMGTVFV